MTEAIAIAADDVQARTVAETMLGLIADDGHVEVAQAELARLTGLSARTLRRALDRLREAHWITVVREATPNAPARYDLTDLADVAQAVGLKPRHEETTAVSSTGTGVLSAEVASDPIGAVQPGQRWLIDPTLLQAGSNIRADLRVGPEFVETIAGLGVLKDIDVYTTLTGLVVEEIREAPGKIDHFLERARDEARRRQLYEDEVLDLRQQGFTVIRREDFDEGFPKTNQYLWNLVDEYDNRVEPHDTCPGNAAYVSVIGSGDYMRAQTCFVCMDYASHGHFTREDRARTTQEVDRAATIEANRQAAQEGEVRRAWIKDVLFKRPLPKDTALLEMPVIYNQAQVSDASQAKGRALVDFDAMGFGLTMSAAQAAKARLAWCIGVLEGGMGRDYWRSRNGERFDSLVQLYLRTLEHWGYPLGEGEEAFCEKVEAAPAVITWGPRAGEVY